MAENWVSRIRNQHDFIFKVLLFAIAVVSVVYLFPKEGKFKYEFQKNKPWVHEDLLAPFDFAINKTEEELAEEKATIIKNQLLFFELLSQIEQEAIADYSAWLELNYNDTLDLLFEKPVYLSKGQALLKTIYEKGIIEIIDELDDVKSGFSILLMDENNIGEEVEIGSFLTIKSAYDFCVDRLKDENEINSSFLILGLEEVLKQNIKYNKNLTQKDLEAKLNSVSIVSGGVYEKEKIISTGELVTPQRFKILTSLKGEYESKIGTSNQSLWIVFGQLILVTLLFYTVFVYLKNTKENIFKDNQYIGFLLLLMVAFVGITELLLKVEEVSVYVIPFCIIPLLIRTFFGNRLAIFIYIITILLISFIVPNSFEFVLLETITGIITLFTVLKVNKRAELFYTAVIIFLIFSVSYIGYAFLQEGDIKKIAWVKLSWFAIAAGLTLLTYPLIYLFEKVFGFISDVTLLELSDTNNELLRELNLKAPGTFQHSLQVSNLAEEGIREIGGNPLLVRTGALYHDIGKMLSPAYFIENQTSGINPHDELDYEESADIIINHVIKGIELAKKHNLPEQIIDFIRTHHGTTKTQYFLRMYAKENSDKEMDETKFQYPGPIPYSKETAVLMMADSVEAASRSLKKYDLESISNLVEGIIDYQVNDNQFMNTNITFNDVTTIKKMFIKKLMNIYHVRIEYPK
jgi:putative nucleotidyltransferase with HDIG domain